MIIYAIWNLIDQNANKNATLLLIFLRLNLG
jgi:hypothetical protein